MGSLLEISQKLNKEYGSDVFMAGHLIPPREKFSIGALSANYALQGGLPEGELIGFSGFSQSGKSLVAAQAISGWQKKHPNKVCLWVDAEGNLPAQIKWFAQMTKMKIDEKHFLRYDCSGKCAEEIFRDILRAEEADDIGLIVLDAIPALVTREDLENPFDKDNGMRASVAKWLGKFCRLMMLRLAQVGNSMILINHTREIGKTHQGIPMYGEPCGHAFDFYPGLKIRFAKRMFTMGDTLDLAQSKVLSMDSKKAAEVDGFCCTFSILKSRHGAITRTGARLIYRYEGHSYQPGIDVLTDLVDIVTTYQIAKAINSVMWGLVKPGTEEYYKGADGKDLTFRGKPALISYLTNNPQFTKEYARAVDEYIASSGTHIDVVGEDGYNEIMAVENAIQLEDDIEEAEEKVSKRGRKSKKAEEVTVTVDNADEEEAEDE